MSKSSLFISCLLALGLHAAPAHALATRTFVAAQGSDSNPCTFALPCRSFQHAHDVTASGGEIDVLDPAGYGALTINKAISIQGHGYAGITATSGNGVTVNAGATDKVNLRGLLIDGDAVAASGVRFISGLALNVQDCSIRYFTIHGIDFGPNVSSSLSVSTTLISDNDSVGVFIRPGASANIMAAFERVEIDRNTEGLRADGSLTSGSIQVVIADSMVANNSSFGIHSFSTASQGHVVVNVKNSTSANNATGLVVDGPNNSSLGQGPVAILLVEQSAITGNTTGWSASNSGIMFSNGNNAVLNEDNFNFTQPPTLPSLSPQ